MAKIPKKRPEPPLPAGVSGYLTPPNFMFRPVRIRLLDELTRQGAPRFRVLSIVAPIGYGKTVLMSELFAWQSRQGESCFWVGLDDRDADLDRVVDALLAALAGHEGPGHPTQILFRGSTSAENRIAGLLGALSGLTAPTTIFIDNLNSCTDAALGALLDALLFRTDPAIRFVWSSTVAPEIDLGRAKLEGLIRQVRLADLCMDAAEVRELLGAELEGHIGLSGIETVLRRTEGWPAAVRMAQIALADASQPLQSLEAFSGSDEDVAALLNRKVLQGFSAELRNFLLCLAQLRTFSVQLCRHAIGVADAERHLEVVLQRNLFVIPLDRNRKWYRLHGLFREYLLGEAERTLDAERKRDVLKRAADWCGRNKLWRDAIEYALASGDAPAASRMLDRTATMFLRDQGDNQQYIDWAERMEAENVQLGWEAHYLYVWALVYRRRFESGRVQHERLAERLRRFSGKANAPAPDLSSRIDHLRICIDLFSDRLADAEAGAVRWLAETKAPDSYNLASVYCIKSCCLASAYRFAQARKTMGMAEPIMREVSGAYSEGWVCQIYGLLSILEGRHAGAYPELLAGRARIGEILGVDSGLHGNMSLVAALCAVETGATEEARELVLHGLRTAHGHGLVDIVACGLEAAVKLWDGTSEGWIALPRLRRIAESYPPRLSLMLACYLTRRLLCLGRLEEAQAQAAHLGFDAGKGDPAAHPEALANPRCRDLWTATAIDLALAQCEFKKAEALIEEEIRFAQADGRIARLVELGLDKAIVALRGGNTRLASKELMLAVIRASRHGILRPFHDRAAAIATLVNDTTPASWSFTLAAERAFFAEICGRLPVENRFLHEQSAGAGADPGPLGTPTRREIELLQLVDLGLSNHQIAAHTSASLNTIKWHLKNLYRKFGVSNRAAALARARALNLLSR